MSVSVVLMAVVTECGLVQLAPMQQTCGNWPPTFQCSHGRETYRPVGVDHGEGECSACHDVPGVDLHSC